MGEEIRRCLGSFGVGAETDTPCVELGNGWHVYDMQVYEGRIVKQPVERFF